MKNISSMVRWCCSKMVSPFAFTSPKLERKFTIFYYGKNLIRMRLICIFAVIFWIINVYSDFTDYNHTSSGIRIANFCLRGVTVLGTSTTFLYFLPFIRHNIYLVELIAIIAVSSLTTFTGVKHAFKNDTTLLPTVMELVGWGCLSYYGSRVGISLISGILGWLGYIITMAAVNPSIVKLPYFYVSSFLVFISYVAFLYQNMCREKEFRLLFLAGRKLKKATKQVKKENEVTDILLKNIFPRHFVENENLRGQRFIQSYDELVILVHDLVSFTAYSAITPGEVLVKQLNHQFSIFELLAEHLYLEKLKSAGDSLTLFALDGRDGAPRCVLMGIEMIQKLKELNAIDKTSFSMRVGIAIGKGYLAVMGNDQMEFDGFGHAMILAEEMEQTSISNRVHVTKEIYEISNQYFQFEKANKPENTETYLLVQGYSSNETLTRNFIEDYKTRAFDLGLPVDSVIDKYVDRISIDQANQSNLTIFGIKPSSSTSNSSESDSDTSDLTLGERKSKFSMIYFKKKYKPNFFTTLFPTFEVSKKFLEKTYKERISMLRVNFILITIMLLSHLGSIMILYPEILLSYYQVIRYTIVFIVMCLVSAFILIPPLAKIPIFGIFTNISIVLLMTIFMYTLMFERRDIIMLLGDQGLIFMIWAICCSTSVPWILKTILLFLCCYIYLIPYSIFGKFYTTIIIVFIGLSFLGIAIFHSVHLAIARSYSSNKILKKELYYLKEEQRISNNLMRSVVPDKLVIHLKNWVDKHFNSISNSHKTTKKIKGLRKLLENRKNRVTTYKFSSTPNFNTPRLDDSNESEIIRTDTMKKAKTTGSISNVNKTSSNITNTFKNYKMNNFMDVKEESSISDTSSNLLSSIKSTSYDDILEENSIYEDLHIFSYIASGTSLFFYLHNYQTLIANSDKPIELISLLHELFSFFDSIIQHLGCTKVKWKGCSYIAIAGNDGKLDHAQALLKAATYMLDLSRRFFQSSKYSSISVKIGLDSGTFYEALVGTSKFRQDYFSDTLNTSSRMASTANPDTIQITERVYSIVKEDFKTVMNEEVEIKGKGKMVTYTVI